MRPKDHIDFLKVLNANLAENPAFSKLFEVTSALIDEHIGEPLSQLARARSSRHIKRGDYIKHEGKQGRVAHLTRVYDDQGTPLDEITLQLNNGQTVSTVRRALQDRATLINASTFMGMDYYSDYLKDEDLARIADYIGSYWPKNGQPEFIKFIGFIKSLSLEMGQLWTKDKGDNATSDDENISRYDQLDIRDSSMRPVWEGGSWYPTSHVEIFYDALISQNIDDDLILLFYVLAPIHLVLERISGSINIDLSYTIKGSAELQLVESGYIKL